MESVEDLNAEERRKVTNLLRWLGGFMAWPGVTFAVVFLLELEDHVLHFIGMVIIATIGLSLAFGAKKLATRFYPHEDDLVLPA